MADPNAGQSVPEKGRVNRVRQEWLVHEDGAFAHNLQQQEYGDKYQWNKHERRQARTDVPLAKYVQTEEEARRQREEMEKLERQRAIAERDAEIAREVHQLEEQKRKIPEHVSRDDAIVAQQFQQQEMVELERERIRRELRDEEYARMLQEKERRRLERRKQQRELATEQKALEAEQQRRAQQLLPGYKSDGKGAPRPELPSGERSPSGTSSIPSIGRGMEELEISDGGHRVLRTDGRVEDVGDFSDFYIQPPSSMLEHQKRELQQLQDEELARLLQDQERKRGAQVNKESLKELEARDAEIARLMQEQEKLKARRKHRSRTQPEAQHPPSVGGTRHVSEGEVPGPRGRVPPGYGRYRSEPAGVDFTENPPPVPTKSAASYHYDQENSYNESMNNANGQEDQPSPNQERSLPIQHYQGRSPYQQRPLPDTPPDTGANKFTVVEVDTARLSPPNSPPPPGYRPPPAYPSKRQDSNTRRSNESSSSSNVIAAIDPTYRDMSPPQQSPPRPPQGSSPPQHHSGPRGSDDSYCDLDDLGPVQGQKRASLPKNGNISKRDSKNRNSSNCKQQ